MKADKNLSTAYDDSELKRMLLNHTDLASQSEACAVQDILQAIRTHLKMEVAFLSEFLGEKRIYRYVDSDWVNNPIHPGKSDPLENTYCHLVAKGVLPELMHDAAKNPHTARFPETTKIPVGAFLSVPIYLSDGYLFGTFCCFSRSPDTTLNQRDLSLMHAFAELAGKAIERTRRVKSIKQITLDVVNKIIYGESMYTAYQAIFNLHEKKITGFEALARFPDLPVNAPDIWFREAHEIGMGVRLEVRAIELAMRNIKKFQNNAYVSMNISPQTITSASIAKLFNESDDLPRIVLEITEHDAVHQYEEISETLKPYRARGLKLAVDDAGAGYASFRHILNLRPDYIKLDISLTRDIDIDPARRALAVALVHFSRDTGSDLIAEGVETSTELSTLIELGITKAQGFFLGRPLRLQELPEHALKPQKIDIS